MGSQSAHMGSQSALREPSQILRGWSQPLRGPSQHIRRPSQNSRGPGQPSRGPSQLSRGPSQPSRGPSQPTKGSSQPLRGPSQPLRGPSQFLRGPSKPLKRPTQHLWGPGQLLKLAWTWYFRHFQTNRAREVRKKANERAWIFLPMLQTPSFYMNFCRNDKWLKTLGSVQPNCLVCMYIDYVFILTKFGLEWFQMKKITCAHVLSASLSKNKLGDKTIGIHDMTLTTSNYLQF